MEKVGKYQILEKLGQGGMGVVYKALDTLIERVVAVKIIASDLDTDPELRARFFREGRSAGRLSHKNIVTIFDLGEEHGTAYIAMEFLEGEDLRAKILRGEQMDLQSKIRIIGEVCAGLAHAHERNVVHRDIKPANIFITTSGQAKILDFGLARTTASDLTTSGHALGTPNYMSPEQVRGERVDYRTDVFSVGVLFYEILTYRKAFQGDSFTSTIFKILQGDPEPIEHHDPTVPPELCSIVYKALAKDRDQRYQTLNLMIEDLDRFLGLRAEAGTETPVRATVRQAGIEIASYPRAASAAAGMSYPAPRTLTPPPIVAKSGLSAGITPRPGPVSGPRSNPPESIDIDSGVNDESTQVEATPRPPVAKPPRLRIAIGVGAAFMLLAMVWIAAHTFGGKPAKQAQGSPPIAAPTSPAATHPQPLAQPLKENQPVPGNDPQIKSDLADASEALKAHKYSEAADGAEKVLKQSPGNAEASSILQQSRDSLDQIQGGIRKAKSFLRAGSYEKAKAALQEVLVIDPANPEALQLNDRINQVARRSAEQALLKMKDSSSKAAGVEAAALAPRTFGAAETASAEASRLFGQRKFDEAAAKAIEAEGLYSSAEKEVRAQAASNAERTRLAEAEKQQASLRARSDTHRRAYEQERDSAIQAGTTERAKEEYAAAERTAGGAAAKFDAGDYEGAAREFEAAASAMRQAHNSALEVIRKEQARAVQPPKPAALAPSQPAPDTRESAEAIQKAIYSLPEQYKAAMEGKNVDLLKSLWPDLTPQQEQAYRDQWAYTRSIRVVPRNPKIEQMQGDSAVLSVLFHNEQEITNGTHRKWDQKATFRLAKRGRSWVIESLSFEGLR